MSFVASMSVSLPLSLSLCLSAELTTTTASPMNTETIDNAFSHTEIPAGINGIYMSILGLPAATFTGVQKSAIARDIFYDFGKWGEKEKHSVCTYIQYSIILQILHYV